MTVCRLSILACVSGIALIQWFAVPQRAASDTPAGQVPGSFRVEEQDGRWWFVDPSGRPFYLVGTDHVSYGGHWCEKLGYSPYGRAAARIYGSEESWATATVQRLQAWGFNALTAGHSASLRHRGLPHIEFLSLGADFAGREAICPKTTWTGFPDVFSTNWAKHCDEKARRMCAPARDDPSRIGYFLDNELEWLGKRWRPDGLFEETWKLAPDRPAKQAWAAFVAAEPGGVVGFNDAFGTAFPDAAALVADTSPRPARTTAPPAIATRWARRVAEEYFRVATEAVRRHDPNHLVLGCRFAGSAPDIWDIAGRYCDVVSFNLYPRIDVDRGVPARVRDEIDAWQRAAGRPMMLTEWSFPALDAGLPSLHGAGMRVDTQAQRAKCFGHFQEFLFRLPYMVGSCYFMYLDEPAQGISSTFPEDSNYGLVSSDDVPWPEIVAVAARLNPRAVELHRKGGFVPAASPVPPSLPAAFRELPPAVETTAAVRHVSGRLTIEGPRGGSGLRMLWDGQPIADVLPRLHQRNGRDDWPRPSSSQVTALRADERWLVLDVAFALEGRDDPGTVPCSFRALMRFWLPQSGGTWLAGQCLRVENTSRRSWRLAGIYHYLDPIPSADRAQVEPLVDIPNYYRPVHAWADRAAGRGVGAWFAEGAPFECHYWKDGDGFHSDLRQETDIELAPGASFAPAADPVYYFPLAGLTPAGYAAVCEQIAKACY
jgi:hypothetical protein